MTKPFSLQTLLDLSQLKMDDAARRLGELLAGEQEAGNRLNLLTQYREEYHQRFLAAAQTGISRDAWSNYQSFLSRLDDAINQANQMVAQSKQRTAAGQQAWLDQRERRQAFDTLSRRHTTQQQSLANRKEQKELDEHTANKFNAAKEDR